MRTRPCKLHVTLLGSMCTCALLLSFLFCSFFISSRAKPVPMPNACGDDTDDDMAEDELDVVPNSSAVPDLEGGCEDEISDDEDGIDHELLLGA